MARLQIIGRFVFDDSDKRRDHVPGVRAIPAARPPDLAWPTTAFFLAIVAATVLLSAMGL